MLTADRTKRAGISPGPTVTWDSKATRLTTSGATEGVAAFVSTVGLVEGLQLVLRLSSPFPYAREVAHLEQLASLAPNWDGHDATRVAGGSIYRAIEFLNQLHVLYPGLVDPPMVGPLPDGGAVLVWRTEKKEVEINFVDEGATIDSAVTDRTGERTEEFQERVGIDSLLSVFVPDHLIG